MNKKSIIIVSVAIFLVLAGGAYFYIKSQSPAATPEGVLPAIDTGAVNPLESAQSANPYEKTNPFSDIKVNPFR